MATTTHKKMVEMSNRTDTQVKIQMINKCKVLIISKGLYKRGGVPMKKGPKKGGTKNRGRREEP